MAHCKGTREYSMARREEHSGCSVPDADTCHKGVESVRLQEEWAPERVATEGQ